MERDRPGPSREATMTAKEAIACIERELRDGDGLWFGGDEAKAALSVLSALADENAALKEELRRLTPEPGNEREDDEVALFGIETAARHNTANPEILDESFAYVRSRMAVARKAEAELSSLRIEADEHRAELKLIANAIGEFYQGRGNVNTILDRIHSVVWVSAMEDKAREKGEKE